MMQDTDINAKGRGKRHSLYCRFCKCIVFAPCRDKRTAGVCPAAADARHYMATGETNVDRMLRAHKIERTRHG